LKQFGLAMHNYHDTNGSFPIGRQGMAGGSTAGPRRTWAFGILNFIEQTSLYNATNFSVDFYFPQNTTVIKTGINSFDCPSDPGGPNIEEPASAYPRAKADYMVNFGNASWDQDGAVKGTSKSFNPFTPTGTNVPPPPYKTVTFMASPFTSERSYGVNSVTDGTSNTLLLSEVKIGINKGNSSDHRGDVYNDDRNCFEFYTYTAPNSPLPDQMQSGYCQYPNSTNPPCFIVSGGYYNAARSFHPGGVNVTLGDGSVKFMKDSIALNVWRALGTMSGGEVISADAY
jgi:prepilin-type processing-associated H-X9-DG protein